MLAQRTRNVFLFALLTTASVPTAAWADPQDDMARQIAAMQQQIDMLQKQLKSVQQQAASAQATAKTASTEAKAASVKTGSAKSPSATADASDSGPGLHFGNKNNIKLTLGGFIEAAGIERSRNETTDLASSWSGIPMPNSSSYHLNEFRGSARQSRLSLLAEGQVDPVTNLAAYFEGDLLGAAPTANSNESNSYTPRLRVAYATMDRSDLGLHVLGGQSWSLVTLEKDGMLPRHENVPMTIEAQYVPGFTWTRNPQVRVVKDFYDKKIWAGLSLESPQAIVFNGPNAPSGGTPVFNNTGGSGFASTSTYSTDLAPDVVAKLAFDPGYGHYEVFGLARFFRDRANGSNNTIMGAGGGAGAILPIIDKKLDFQISGLAGSGVGRYGSAQLPDVTIKPNGTLATVDEIALLAGLSAHPDEKWDLYLYGGTERSQKRDFTAGGKGYGYGNALYNNSGCLTEGAAATTCVANTSSVSQLTAGAWWKFYKGGYGMMEVGAQDSYTTRNIFAGVGGSPNTDDNITMVSFRYYPF